MRIPFAFMRAPDAGAPPAPLEYPSGLKGINLSGGSDLDEWWSFPSTTAIDYYYAQGFNFFRIPFRWERLQHAVGGELDATHLADLDAAVQYALGKGADVRVMLVAHNFGGRYETGGNGALPIGGEPEQKIGGALVGGFQVTRAHFADFWSRVATYYADEPRVVFDLMNEPESMPADGYGDGTMQLVAAYNDAIAAIRANETETHLIALEGHGWNNAQSFSDDWYGTENSVAFLSIVDSADYWVASVHDYPDVDHGDEGDAVSDTALSDRIANVLTWAAANDRKVMVGEFATHTDDPLGDDVISDFLDTIGADAHVVGWAWWEGRSSADTSSGYNIPWDSEDGDDAKLAWLAPYLTDVSAPVLSSLNYAQGDTLGGGQPIVLTGTGFTGATLVEFGSASATFVVDSDTQITATLPAHAAAVVDVTVTGPGGSDTLTLAFEYWDPTQLSATTIFCEDWDGSATWAARGGSVPDTLSRVSATALSQGAGAGGFTSAEGVGGSGNNGRFKSTQTIDQFCSQQPSGTATIVWALCKPTSSADTFNPSAPYAHRAFIGTDGGGYLILGHTNDGFFGNVYDGAYEAVSAPCALGTGNAGIGAWHMVVFRTTTTVSQISVDGSSLAAASVSQNLSLAVGAPYLLQVMTDYSGSLQFGGELLAFGLTKGDGTDAEVLKLRKWAQQRFGVAV